MYNAFFEKRHVDSDGSGVVILLILRIIYMWIMIVAVYRSKNYLQE